MREELEDGAIVVTVSEIGGVYRATAELQDTDGRATFEARPFDPAVARERLKRVQLSFHADQLRARLADPAAVVREQALSMARTAHADRKHARELRARREQAAARNAARVPRTVASALPLERKRRLLAKLQED